MFFKVNVFVSATAELTAGRNVTDPNEQLIGSSFLSFLDSNNLAGSSVKRKAEERNKTVRSRQKPSHKVADGKDKRLFYLLYNKAWNRLVNSPLWQRHQSSSPLQRATCSIKGDVQQQRCTLRVLQLLSCCPENTHKHVFKHVGIKKECTMKLKFRKECSKILNTLHLEFTQVPFFMAAKTLPPRKRSNGIAKQRRQRSPHRLHTTCPITTLNYK